jgi:hypothetical protein
MTNDERMTNPKPPMSKEALRPSSFGLRYSFIILLLAATCRAEPPGAITVGMPSRINGIVLPGSRLEARPLDNARSPIVLRIANVMRQGGSYKYEIVWYGLEPGTYDLRDYLRRRDGTSTEDLMPLRVKVASLLPAGQMTPNALESSELPWLGGYRLALAVGGVFWTAGLFAILLVGRRKKETGQAGGPRPLTLADRLRPLVLKAQAGTLSRTERADLERILLAYWRGRLGLGDRKPSDTFALLRSHPEAGPLLDRLEAWLHRPGAAGDVDVASLLRPYETLPADAAGPVAAKEVPA